MVIDTKTSFQWFNLDDADEALHYAKEHPFHVQLEFDRRLRVWRDTVERNRQLHIQTLDSIDGRRELIRRYVLLDIADYNRLYQRAKFEFLYVANDRDITRQTLIFAKNLFWQAERHLKSVLYAQLTVYERLGIVDIIHYFKNGWKELI